MKTAGSRRAELLRNALLSVASVCLVLAGLEGASRLLEPKSAEPAVAPYITDWAQWEGDFYTVKSAAAGWPPFEDYNHDGLRDREHELVKPPGVRRLVCLGDSTTAGYRIQADEAYPQVLQDLLDALGYRVEVFNVALGGWSTHQELLAYQRIARKYRPDVVLVGVCLNDIPELGNNLSRPPAWVGDLYRHFALVRRLVAASHREIRSVEELMQEPESEKVRRAYGHLFEHLRTLRDEVQADGARFGVLVFPFRLQLEPDSPPPIPQRKIAAFCAEEGIPHLDLLPAIRAAGEDAFVDYDHFSPLGSQVVASQVVAADLVPPGSEGAGLPSEIEEHLEGPHAPLPALLEALGSADPVRRAGAAKAIALLGDEAVAARPALVARASDEDARVRAAAVWALGRLGPGSGSDVATLDTRLADEAPTVRAAAAWALGQLGPEGRPAEAHLLARLGDPDPEVRRRVAAALQRIGPDADVCRPAAESILADPASPARAEAARVLGLLGPSAAAATPALARALRDADPQVRRAAVTALEKIGPGAQAAVPALVDAMSDPDLRWRVPDALGSIGPGARRATEVLIVALSDPVATVRWRAAVALGRIRPNEKRLGAELARLAEDPQQNVRLGAVVALGRIGADPDLQVRTLVRALGDPDAEVRTKAADGLGRLGPAAAPAIPALGEASRDADAWVRVSAVRALGRVGKDSPAALAALSAARDDSEEMVRTQVTAALRRVTTASR